MHVTPHETAELIAGYEYLCQAKSVVAKVATATAVPTLLY